jgi:2-polyprenyl-3-methyl-5-hydroxy-6-metoxy-1,4-benzoquinol methylase/uncharacterized protein YbaR (Trm112 family)
MQLKLLEVLACPKCSGGLSCTASETNSESEVLEGRLICSSGVHEFRVENGIPRFVSHDNYAQSFGYQWNRFKLEQIDSANGTRLSAERFFSETGWTTDWLKNKWILDAGCGAGRFLDVAARTDCDVVGLDITEAIDAAKANLADRTNVHFVQASIYELPFRHGSFDGCYCIGVVQHTPNPQKATEALPAVLRRGGRIAISAYERKPWTRFCGKYLLRPITKRVDKQRLLARITRMMPFLFPITDVLFRLPFVGRLFMFAIPVANYVQELTLTQQQRYQWAVLDTFDMLSPQYDSPRTQEEVEYALGAAGIVEMKRIPGRGVNIVGRKGS